MACVDYWNVNSSIRYACENQFNKLLSVIPLQGSPEGNLRFQKKNYWMLKATRGIQVWEAENFEALKRNIYFSGKHSTAFSILWNFISWEFRDQNVSLSVFIF